MQRYSVVFPGQGSQSVGMLHQLAADTSIIKQTFDEASQVLGYDLWQVVQQGTQDELDDTQVTQPAMLVADVAVWRYLINELHLPMPAYGAGHSLGEYSALVASGALAFEQAVKLVETRAKLMQQASEYQKGAMIAVIGLNDEAVATMCHELADQGEVLAPANYNAPGQVVVAGHEQAVARVEAQAKSKGAKMAKRLPVSVPAHCQLMEPARQHFADYLRDVTWQQPHFPVLHNIDANSREPGAFTDALVQQLVAPVQWVTTVNHMADHGAKVFVESGPGKVLAGLNKRIDKQITTYTVENVEQLAQMNA